jgi:hypothetical protein
MTSSKPLQDSELIDCVRANSGEDITVVAQRCGYGGDLMRFEQGIKHAGQTIGIDIQGFDDLIRISEVSHQDLGLEIAPETFNRL